MYVSRNRYKNPCRTLVLQKNKKFKRLRDITMRNKKKKKQ